MAVKTSSPWWVSGILAFGLTCLFAGQRVLAHLDTASTLLTILGLTLVAGATGARIWAFGREKGKRKAVEGLLLLCHAGVIAALLVYFLFASDQGPTAGGADATGETKAHTVATVAWLILMAVSLVPLLMAEISLGLVGRDWFPKAGDKVADEAAVELFRVREMAGSGLTVALAAAFLMVTCNIAKERDVRKDVSYFKTSQPGESTVNMVGSLSEPLRVMLFFPEVNQVGDEVQAYFEQLGDTTGKVVVERYDRMVAPQLAKDFKVNTDGSIVLVKGESAEAKAKREKEEAEDAAKEAAKDKAAPTKKADPVVPPNEKFTITTEYDRARNDKLRELDKDVQKALMKVIRSRRVAYFSIGHGELNDPKSAGVNQVVDSRARTSVFKQILQVFNYEVKDWDGFGKPIPDDATTVFVLGPKTPLLPEDLASIDDFLDKGGSAFIALDPKSEATLGVLEGRLGIKYDKTPVTDDKEFWVARRNPSDHRIIATNQFSSHASVTTLSRAGVKARIPMAEVGNLVDADFMVEEGTEPPKRTYVIRSMSSSFLDLNDNFTYDDGTEKKARYNLAAAVDDPSRKRDTVEPGQVNEGMRAMVFADVDIFSDPVLAQFGGLQYVVRDAALWLGGEEKLAGETVSEKDVKIEHTKEKDVVWFYLSLVGAPLVLLALGLGGVSWRKRRSQRRRS